MQTHGTIAGAPSYAVQGEAGPAAQAQPSTTAESECSTAAPGRALWALIYAVSFAGAAILATGVPGLSHADWDAVVVLACMAVVAERSDFSLYGDSRVSLTFVPIFAALILSGVPGLAVVVLAASAASAGGCPLYKTAFNFGTLMIAGAASLVVFHAFGQTADAASWPGVLAPALAAAAVNFAVNSVLVAFAIAASGRSRVTSVWAEHFLWLWPHYLVLGVLGVAMAAADTELGIWGIAVFLVPPLMMRLSLKQYVDRTTKSVLELRHAHAKLEGAHEQVTAAMASLGKAYDGTLRSLVAALDARDTETAGHSERVADLTMAMAAEMGIEAESDLWHNISWGALLHDVGKIAIPDGILRKPSSLTDEEWVAMRTHPRAGYEILLVVDFLAPAAEIVLAHHERYDGAGYPRGLAGEEIPLGARIFMIADAFDAMTSHRTYRRAMPAVEALAEILRNSGTQFDPVAVRAFLSVYQQRFVEAGQLAHSPTPPLSDSLKRAIVEATAGLEANP